MILVGMVDKNWLANEAAIALDNLCRWEVIIVIVTPTTNGSRSDVEKARPRVIVKGCPVPLAADGAIAAVLEGEDLQAGVLDHGITSPLHGSRPGDDRS
jgi:hypothetical protein